MSAVIRIRSAPAMVAAWAFLVLLSLTWLWYAALLFVLLGAFGADSTGDVVLVIAVFLIDPIALLVFATSLRRSQISPIAVALVLLATAFTIGAVVY